MAVEILVSADKECKGVILFNTATKEHQIIYTSALIIATGGAGQVYKYTTNPNGATGDGIALAYEAGAIMQDMEFMQFHPTSLYAPSLKKAFLISEAVRGYGGILKNSKGEEFMNGVHPLRSLAPRDIVARAIHREMKRTGEPCMFLDVTAHNPKDTKTHFPHIYAKCLSAGVDMTKEWIPVVPAAHYMCGGVLVDTWSKTPIEGLYASGEVAATGVHGANRLASNSLLESVVFALRAVENIEKTGILKKSFRTPNVPSEKVKMTGGEHWKKRTLEAKKLMWEKCGIVRSVAGLNEGLAKLREFNCEVEAEMKKPGPKTAALLEFRNAVESSILIVKSALARKESRGLQSILDYPKMSPKVVHHNIYLKYPLESN
jgi:L-aspartate oxidase